MRARLDLVAISLVLCLGEVLDVVRSGAGLPNAVELAHVHKLERVGEAADGGSEAPLSGYGGQVAERGVAPSVQVGHPGARAALAVEAVVQMWLQMWFQMWLQMWLQRLGADLHVELRRGDAEPHETREEGLVKARVPAILGRWC